MESDKDKEPHGKRWDSYLYEISAFHVGSNLCHFMHAHDQSVPLIGECWTERYLEVQEPRVEPFLARPSVPYNKAPC